MNQKKEGAKLDAKQYEYKYYLFKTKCGKCGKYLNSFSHLLACEGNAFLSAFRLKTTAHLGKLRYVLTELRESIKAKRCLRHLTRFLLLQQKSNRKIIRAFRVYNVQVHDTSELAEKLEVVRP